LLQLNKGTDHQAILLVWYPALKAAGGASKATLTVSADFQLQDSLLDTHYWGPVIKEGTPDTAGAPYPLVIFSPGYGETGVSYATTESHLASYGFVVVATAIPIDPSSWENDLTRPPDTSREVDFAESLNGQDGSFKGLIDTKHVGVAGHSEGGYTALALGGARYDLAWFEQWCADHKDSSYAISYCSDTLSRKKELLALAKLDSMPADLWPSWRDPRVAAIVSQAGHAVEFGHPGLSEVTIPVMVQVGSDDNDAAPEVSAYLTYDSVSSAQKAQVVFEGADHMIFLDTGATASTRDLIHHFTTAFLLDVLKGDKDAHKALLPDAVKFAGIDYKTTLK
jgi:predicted dienelactone hydrolase